MTFDDVCRQVTSDNPNMLIPWFLMACYAYDLLGEPLLTDSFFDEMSETMNMVFPALDHAHKHLITWDENTTKGSSSQVAWGSLPDRIGRAVAFLRK